MLKKRSRNKMEQFSKSCLNRETINICLYLVLFTDNIMLRGSHGLTLTDFLALVKISKAVSKLNHITMPYSND